MNDKPIGQHLCTCGAPLLVTKVKSRQYVALCSKPCMETRLSYGESETDCVKNYENRMREAKKNVRA